MSHLHFFEISHDWENTWIYFISCLISCFHGQWLDYNLNQVANMIRFYVDSYKKPIPAILEIPSKDHPYDPAQDSILSRVKGMFSSESVASGRHWWTRTPLHHQIDPLKLYFSLISIVCDSVWSINCSYFFLTVVLPWWIMGWSIWFIDMFLVGVANNFIISDDTIILS